MNIRCERCSTIYELDEKLLAPGGSPVQCTKCQHVFTAVPPRAAGRTLAGIPAAPPPAPVAAPRVPVAPASSAASAQGARQGPAIYKPSQPASTSVVKGPRPRKDTMGAFEARLKSAERLRWMVPLAIALVAIVAVAGWLFLSGGADPAAQRRHAEAMALVAQDDVTSLEKASQAFEELSRQRTGLQTIDADRALAQILLATGLLEDVAGPSERLARKMADRDRLAAAQAAPEVIGPLSAEIEALRVQVDPKAAKAKALSERAYGTLKQLAGQREGELAVTRALAIHFASSGDREQALRFIRAAPASAERDPWIGLAEGWLDAREEAKEVRERGAAKLTALVASHPEIVRARFLLARAQAALGRREQAAATLDGLLAANPNHHRARKLREELVVSAALAPGGAPMPVGPAAGRPPVPPAAAPAPRPVGPVGPAPTPPPAPLLRPVPAPGVPPPAPAPSTGMKPAPQSAPSAPAATNPGVAPAPRPAVAPAAPAAQPAAQPHPAAPAAVSPPAPAAPPKAQPDPGAAAKAPPAPAPAAAP